MENRLTNQEIGIFLSLFIRGGYVLSFSTNSDFNSFTMQSIGIGLCTEYNLSKGKSLNAYIFEPDVSEDDKIKLLLDLFEYYEQNMKDEYEKKTTFSSISSTSTNSKYLQAYKKAKEIVARISQPSSVVGLIENLQTTFSSEYLDKQYNIMQSTILTNPTEAIGKAKELIETCSKTILSAKNIPIDKEWSFGELISKTFNVLQLMPANIATQHQDSEAIKAVLGNLRGIASNIGTIRNFHGSGHGKSANYQSIEAQYARLAVGSSVILVQFLWDAFQAESTSQKP